MLGQSNDNVWQRLRPDVKALIVFAACALFTGCSQSREVSLADIATTEADESIERASKEARTLTLVHDFGVVRPGERHTHSFAIRNTSDQRWTIARVHVNCRCTVTSASSRWIDPGQTEQLHVTYTVGKAPTDDARTVEVAFAEDFAPTVRLIVKAQSRDVVTISPNDLVFSEVAQHSVAESDFEVNATNFSR